MAASKGFKCPICYTVRDNTEPTQAQWCSGIGADNHEPVRMIPYTKNYK